MLLTKSSPFMLSDNLIIQFPKIGGEDQGYISIAEVGKTCPFPIQRTYWIYDCPEFMKRGGHAHRHNLHQILICVTGQVEVVLFDGFDKKVFTLNTPTMGLYQPPLVWGDLIYQQNSVLLVLASKLYAAEDYIRDYQEFLDIAHSARK